jgi:hypothetical protein
VPLDVVREQAQKDVAAHPLDRVALLKMPLRQRAPGAGYDRRPRPRVWALPGAAGGGDGLSVDCECESYVLRRRRIVDAPSPMSRPSATTRPVLDIVGARSCRRRTNTVSADERTSTLRSRHARAAGRDGRVRGRGC